MRYLSLILLLPLFTSCFQPGVEDRFQFSGIYNTLGDTLIPVDEEDFMEIRAGGSFYYELKAKDLIAEGTWEMKGPDTMVFTYIKPSDTTRFYHLQEVSDQGITLHEGDVFFSFRRN